MNDTLSVSNGIEHPAVSLNLEYVVRDHRVGFVPCVMRRNHAGNRE